MTYSKQNDARMSSLIGTADFYSSNLNLMGFEAWDVIANIEPMQKTWMKENGLKLSEYELNLSFKKGFLPWISKNKKEWLFEILRNQIKVFKPDVIYSMAIETIDNNFLKSVKDYYRLAIGQHAASLNHGNISEYDLILSSLPNQVEYFIKNGIESKLFKLGFEPKILDELKKDEKKYDIVFIGGFGKDFGNSTKLIERLLQKFDFKIWGYCHKSLSEQSIIRKKNNGVSYGKNMYQTLMDSKIVFNRHADFSETYANNMRLYQSTGVGSFLLTDQKDNLNDIFEKGDELETYVDVDDCIEKVEYFLANDKKREEIATLGHKRCLEEHTWFNRMNELSDIINKII